MATTNMLNYYSTYSNYIAIQSQRNEIENSIKLMMKLLEKNSTEWDILRDKLQECREALTKEEYNIIFQEEK